MSYCSRGWSKKDMHESEAIRKHYRLVVPPKRARSTLTCINQCKAES
ncbi:hypothetical protein SAMN04487881_2574 [Marinobacter sp. es.048]|nr:hypothetical protein [Marinobacter sp. es.048]SNC74817.1 hypothetical protein SAMN04487881_2574 [Marinobacter sp. es.048]